MALNPYGTAGQIGPQRIEAGYSGGEQFGIYGPQGNFWSPSMDPSAFNMPGYSLQSRMEDSGPMYWAESTNPFWGQGQQLAQQYGFGSTPTQLGDITGADMSRFKDPSRIVYDPTYGYLTGQDNFVGKSLMEKISPLLTMAALATGLGAAGSAGLFGANAAAGAGGGVSGGSLGSALTGAVDPFSMAGAAGAGGGAGAGASLFDIVQAPITQAGVPQGISLAPGAGLANPISVAPGAISSTGAAATGIGSIDAALGLGAGFGGGFNPTWGVNAAQDAGVGGLADAAAAAGLNEAGALAFTPALAGASGGAQMALGPLALSSPIGTSLANFAAGLGTPVAGGIGSIYNSTPGLFSSLFDDPKELLKLLGGAGLSFIGGNQQEKIAGQAAQQADPYQAYRPGDAAQFQQVQNATNFDNPVYNAMRDQMERATIRRGAQGGNLGSASLVNELMTRNAALFNDYRNQELQRLGLTSGAFRDPSMAAQILGGGKAAGLATKYGGGIDALSDFLTPDDPYRDLILTMMRG